MWSILGILGLTTITATLEPPIGTNFANSGTQSNLAVFMVLFMLCAMEVVLIKIVAATSSATDESIDFHEEDRLNNNHFPAQTQ